MNFPEQSELAPSLPIEWGQVQRPRYGRFLEEFSLGETVAHPRSLTVYPAFAQEFATTFMQANPRYLDEAFAQRCGFGGLPVMPLLVLNLALSLGVQNDSEQAIAHLGYYNVVFPRPLLAGDTLRSRTTVLGRRFRGAGQAGIVRLRTEALNGRGEIVCRYERAVLVPSDGSNQGEAREETADVAAAENLPVDIPFNQADSEFSWASGDIIVHPNGRTVTDEHMSWAYRLGNTHPLHYDAVYSGGREGAMGGKPIVYGGLVFAWLEGLASRDVSAAALWDLGYTEGYHTQPVISGDTLYAISRVLQVGEKIEAERCGLVNLQLVGVKNMTGAAALGEHGAALFEKESGKEKAARIAEKVFEIERRLLVRI